MKRNCVLIALIVSSLLFASCGRSSEPPYFGVFLEEDGELVEMVQFRGKPDSPTATGIPSTSNPEPVIVMWNPDVVLEFLNMSSLTGAGQISYNVSPREGDILEIRPVQSLANDTYCLTQGDPLLPFQSLSNWCFRVGPLAEIQSSPSKTSDNSGQQPTVSSMTPIGSCEPIIGEWAKVEGNYWLTIERSGEDVYLFHEFADPRPDYTYSGIQIIDGYELELGDIDGRAYCDGETLVIEHGDSATILYRVSAEPDISDRPLQTCNGWALHVAEVTRTDLGDGWMYLEGVLAIENVSATDGGIIPIYDFISQPPVMRTTEGFTYTMDRLDTTLPNSMVAPEWVPPGFQYRAREAAPIDGFEPTGWKLGFKVASSSTGHIVETQCGTLNFSQVDSLVYPTTQTFTLSVESGVAYQSSAGPISFSFDTGCEYGSVCLSYDFWNSNQGYEATPQFYIKVISSDGIVYGNREGGPWMSDSYMTVRAGPGQSVNGRISFMLPSLQDSYLIVAEWPLGGDYWLVKLYD